MLNSKINKDRFLAKAKHRWSVLESAKWMNDKHEKELNLKRKFNQEDIDAAIAEKFKG